MKKKRDIEGNRLHHFELSDKNRTVRWVLIAVLLAVAAVAIIIGLVSALQTPAGWQTVEASTTKLNCSGDFVLQYEYGAGDMSPSMESKALESLYGKAAENAWQLFYNEADVSADRVGLYELNQHPNEQIAVDGDLYRALEQVVKSGSRALYLAPVYAAYDRVFYSTDTIIAEDNDPTKNPEIREYVQTLAGFANDPESIQLVLDTNYRVTLQVSEKYLAFTRENEVEYLLDFGWLRNAFVVDYIAFVLVDNGFTNGYLTSVDGFTRNLDRRNTPYSFNLFSGGQSKAVMQYQGAISLAFLRSYPMYEEDAGRYYTFADGRTVTALIDPSDGQSKTAADQLVSYSTEAGCAELALSMLPLYVADDLDESLINKLTGKKIYSIWFEGKELRYNEQVARLTVTDSAVTATYAG